MDMFVSKLDSGLVEQMMCVVEICIHLMLQ